MKPQIRIWIAMWRAYSEAQNGRRTRSATASAATRRVTFIAEDSLRPDEHHHDEQEKGQHIGELDGKVEPADRDDLAHDKGGDKPADHVAEPAQHADHESDRAEGIADEGVHIVLQYEEAGCEPGQPAADRRGCEID